MILTDQSIKSQIRFQIPWFYNQEYPTFVKFLEYYYQWLETFDDTFRYGVLAIIDNYKQFKDIDKTVDQLLPFFKNPYYRNIPDNTAVAKRLFIKRMVDLYRSKGSLKSLHLLIKIILGEDVVIWYPKESLARSSNSESSSYFYAYLKLTDITISPIELQNNTITLSGIPVIISLIVQYTDFYEMILDFDLVEFDTIQQTTDVYFQGVKIGELIPLLKQVSFVRGTRICKQGELFTISSVDQKSPAVCRIKHIRPGRINAYNILRSGSGYNLGDEFIGYIGTEEFSALVSNITPIGEIGRLTIFKNAAVTSEPPTVVSKSITGKDAIIDWYSTNFTSIEEIEIIDAGVNLVSPFTTSIPNVEFAFETATVVKRTQSSSTNNLGNYNILSDNLLWQDHSYILNYLSNYSVFPRTEIDTLFKPLGSKLFYNKNEEFIFTTEEDPEFIVDGSLTEHEALKLETILVVNLHNTFDPIRKYTNDTPLSFVASYPISGVNTKYCFEVKPEITVLTLAIVDNLDNLENAVNQLQTCLTF